MYLHLGQDVVVLKKNIVGIFDLDNASSSHITREFLAKGRDGKGVSMISGRAPKVFAVCEKKGKTLYTFLCFHRNAA
jgi:hypothetical protein